MYLGGVGEEQKKQKFSEIKIGLDDAEALVICCTTYKFHLFLLFMESFMVYILSLFVYVNE
ncbi:hypothetical protein DVH24_038586 [Malus domestica]|uniref:Uncharacterized protein n=1 Tax=Malus domestica TaxID=3750 RepID=A0A498KFG9_MALDO|nr:hypothetical protein DVH24_038586 [Malus domestica]